MIVPMKKIHLVVLDSDRVEVLKALRKLGLVHVVAKPAAGPSLDSLNDRLSKAEAAFSFVRDIKVETTAASGRDPQELVSRILAIVEERKSFEDNAGRLFREIDRLKSWGPFDPAGLETIVAAGVDLVPFELSEKTYAALPENARVLVLSRGAKTVRCLVLREDGKLPEGMPPECVPLALPEVSTAELGRLESEARANAAERSKELLAIAAEKSAIKDYSARLRAEIEFDSHRLGMDRISRDDQAEALALLEGYAPSEDVPRLIAAAKKHGWAMIADDPSPDDHVPTKIKNHPIVAMVQPIFDFLGTVPNYREYEISAWFLLFFCFFFAMIFGDAVYGAVLLSAGVIGAVLAKRSGKPVPNIMKLLITLSSFTVLWGVFTLTYLGIQPDKLPDFLKLIDIDWISNANPDSGEHIKVLCFIIGTVQLSIAHIKNVRRDFATLKWLGQLGQLFMMIGMMSVVFNLVISSEKFPIPTYAFFALGGGFLLSFVFSNYEGNILKSILASFANFVSVFLGIVNVFADIVSYIRLWAVGLAGLAISQTVNNMLGPMLGKLSLFAVGVLSLVFAHGFNIILGFLSVIVHGVRLNMLEFSGHLGMEWSGFEYHPFKERIVNDDVTSKEQL